MVTDCNGFLLLWGLVATCIGLCLISAAVQTWRNREPEQATWSNRLLLSAAGTFFAVFGSFMLWTQLQCKNIPGEFLSVAHLEFQSWQPVWPYTLFAAAIAFVNAQRRRLSVPLKILAVAFGAAFGFCAAEAAAYHTGEMANRWSTATAVALLLASVPYGADWFARHRSES